MDVRCLPSTSRSHNIKYISALNFPKSTNMAALTNICLVLYSLSLFPYYSVSFLFSTSSTLLSSRKVPSQIKGICIEKIGNGSYTSMAAHPDGSDRVFFSSQEGKIWLAIVPEIGSNRMLDIDEFKPFLDISDRVLFQTSYGLLGMAFHPEFVKNGRFFVYFNCDKLKHLGCSGKCSCNTDANCDPATLPPANGLMPCQYHNVIAEYITKGDVANSTEARRIFTMGLPFNKGHAAQILFGPSDGYLYTLVADNSARDDTYNYAQNKKFLLGKVLRFDVDNIPSITEVYERNLWGNYSIPEDNPYKEDKGLLPEIWALGFNNAWRCSFDAERPSLFLCADAGQDMYEEVDIITKGGNYGWPIYEGPFLSPVGESQTGNNPPDLIHPIFPVMGYNHSEIKGNASSIIGGYFYRSRTDPCLYGRYMYTDVYAQSIRIGTEYPENSGKFSTMEVPYFCAKDSPLVCKRITGSSAAFIGYTFSFGEDNRKDIYILTSTGVYRVAHPKRCNFSCSESGFMGGHGPTSSSASSSYSPHWRIIIFVVIVFSCYLGCLLY